MKLTELQSIYTDVLAQKNNTPKIRRMPRESGAGPRVQAIISGPDYNSVKPEIIERANRLCENLGVPELEMRVIAESNPERSGAGVCRSI